MEAWERWWQMAVSSLDAAKMLENKEYLRPGASRSYYAAYQAASSAVLYLGTTPPVDREAWSHEATPELLRRQLRTLLPQNRCNDLARRLGTLYKLRIDADYISDTEINSAALQAALKDASF